MYCVTSALDQTIITASDNGRCIVQRWVEGGEISFFAHFKDNICHYQSLRDQDMMFPYDLCHVYVFDKKAG